MIYILEKLPETLRPALGLWICVLLVGNSVTGKFPTRWDHDEGGRRVETLGCLPGTRSRQMKQEGRERAGGIGRVWSSHSPVLCWLRAGSLKGSVDLGKEERGQEGAPDGGEWKPAHVLAIW